MVKNPPAMQEKQETQVGSLNQEEPLRKDMATHFSILSWRIPLTEATVHGVTVDGLESTAPQRVGLN